MKSKHPEALALAFRRAMAKSNKIKELKISPESTDEDIEAIIVSLSHKKAEIEGKDWTEYVKGQRWYVEDLQTFSGLEPQAKLNAEYKQCFPDVASEDEMLDALAA